MPPISRITRQYLQHMVHITVNPTTRPLGEIAEELEAALAHSRCRQLSAVSRPDRFQQQRKTFPRSVVCDYLGTLVDLHGHGGTI